MQRLYEKVSKGIIITEEYLIIDKEFYHMTEEESAHVKQLKGQIDRKNDYIRQISAEKGKGYEDKVKGAKEDISHWEAMIRDSSKAMRKGEKPQSPSKDKAKAK